MSQSSHWPFAIWYAICVLGLIVKAMQVDKEEVTLAQFIGHLVVDIGGQTLVIAWAAGWRFW